MHVETITKEELYDKLIHGEPVQVVNALHPDFYYLGCIKGSMKIPLEDLEAHLDELDKQMEVVTYYAHHECVGSRKAAEKLAAKGFKVKAYEGGIKEWKEAGLPLE